MAYRAIQDTVNRSESLAQLSDLAERLFWRLLAGTDSYGRLAASPAKLRAHCWPLLPITDRQAGAALLELAEAGRIHAYTVDGVTVIQLDAFERHQPADLFRKRGKPQFPANPDEAALGPERAALGASRAVLAISTIYNIPANKTFPAPGPDQGSPRAGQSRVEESRREEQQQQHYVARANPHPAEDVERAAAALEEIGLTLDAGADPARVLAWCELARTAATSNPAGFVRSGMASGAWPSPRSSPAENGSKPRRAIAEVVRDIIRNVGAELDPHAFAAEVAQLEARRGETIPRDVAEELVEEHRKVSQSQFAADPGSDAA